MYRNEDDDCDARDAQFYTLEVKKEGGKESQAVMGARKVFFSDRHKRHSRHKSHYFHLLHRTDLPLLKLQVKRPLAQLKSIFHSCVYRVAYSRLFAEYCAGLSGVFFSNKLFEPAEKES